MEFEVLKMQKLSKAESDILCSPTECQAASAWSQAHSSPVVHNHRRSSLPNHSPLTVYPQQCNLVTKD